MNKRKNVIITGATGAIGYGIAKLISALPDYRIILIARNKKKAELTVQHLQRDSQNPHISYLLADLSLQNEVQNLAGNLDFPVSILINNAAITPRRREESKDGIEMQWATNVLGYFWMMKYFKPHLKLSTSARIVNVASYWAGGLDMNDPEFNQRHYNNDMAYRQSKQADRMLSTAFAEKFKDFGISVNACHPGDVSSSLASNLGFGGHETAEQAALTPVWLATSDEIGGVSGKYFENRQESACRFSRNKEEAFQLVNLCENY